MIDVVTTTPGRRHHVKLNLDLDDEGLIQLTAALGKGNICNDEYFKLFAECEKLGLKGDIETRQGKGRHGNGSVN